jgi:hypothetical protein
MMQDNGFAVILPWVLVLWSWIDGRYFSAVPIPKSVPFTSHELEDVKIINVTCLCNHTVQSEPDSSYTEFWVYLLACAALGGLALGIFLGGSAFWIRGKIPPSSAKGGEKGRVGWGKSSTFALSN